jgi:hypothetical protein
VTPRSYSFKHTGPKLFTDQRAWLNHGLQSLFNETHDKKTQRTPVKELHIANRRMKELYLDLPNRRYFQACPCKHRVKPWQAGGFTLFEHPAALCNNMCKRLVIGMV